MTAKMTPEQRNARRKELAAQYIARMQECAAQRDAAEARATASVEHRKVLAVLYRLETGEDATIWLGCPDASEDGDGCCRNEFEYDNQEFVDWLILRYVAAAGPTYAMTEADTKALADTMRKNDKRRPTKKERELVELYAEKEGN
jgi:hypothetical protein